ncbi:MAG: MFS transporter [Pseudomonadales bacterium]
MSQHQHYETALEDRISIPHKIIYGTGAFVNNLLAAAIGGMAIVLNLGLGMNPALVGLLGALPRLLDAFTDPLMGYISDHTKSKWGRRRPYIFFGAIAVGVVFALLWQLPRGQSEMFYFWFFLIGSLIFYLSYTVFATPWVALGYELTPDYHERTRLMAVQNFMGQLAYLISPWFLWFMQYELLFGDLVEGAGWLAILIAAVTIGVGILPAIFLKERHQQSERKSQMASAAVAEEQSSVTSSKENANLEEVDAEKPSAGITDFFKGFVTTIKFRPFLSLCAATFLVFNGFMMVASFQNYVIIYYVFAGDQSLGAEYAGWAGTASAISTFCAIFIVSWLSTKIGKRRAFFIATSISIIGYGMKWFCYTPDNPLLILLPTPLIAFGLGGLFTLMGSMIADVCDMDELETNQRREGMFGSIYWWVVKLGMAVALAAGGFLLNATGFDVALGGNQSGDTIFMMRLFDVLIPMACSAIAIWMIATYPITEEKAHQIRLQLEQRKGKIVVNEHDDGYEDAELVPV